MTEVTEVQKSKVPRHIFYLFVIALLLRVGLAFFVPDEPVTGDEMWHMQYARSFTLEPEQWATINIIDNFWQIHPQRTNYSANYTVVEDKVRGEKQ